MRYYQLNYVEPSPWQTVLGVWDTDTWITSPNYVGVERRKGIAIDCYRGNGRWFRPQYGAKYSGYYDIPNLHDWQNPLRVKHDALYLLYFSRASEILPSNFFINGPVFMAKAHYSEQGFDWRVVPNTSDRRNVHVGENLPSKCHPIILE